MPRIKKMFVLPFSTDRRAWLGVDAGVGKSVPTSEEQKQRLRQRMQGLRQRFHQEKERRLQAERFPVPVGSQEDEPQIFRGLLSTLKPGRMLDLGTGPGTSALIAAELGWDVTAVDARTGRTPDPAAEKDPDRAELIRSIRWVEADAREFPIHSGEYDLICLLRFLHHFELNDQIELLRRCSDTLTLLNVRIVRSPARANLTRGSYRGRLVKEAGETHEERALVQTASWGNEVSFEHTEESLLRLVLDCGYSRVWSMRPPQALVYNYYLCLPYPKPSP